MSHVIIIEDVVENPGFAAASDSGSVHSEIRFTPPHHLSAEQQIRRADKAKQRLQKIREMLLAPADAPEE